MTLPGAFNNIGVVSVSGCYGVYLFSKEELKVGLKKLIEDYNSYSEDEQEKMSEDSTRAKFIDPLLKDILGWDERNIDRQTSIEALTSSGHMKRADYSYPLVPKIIVEAKKLKVSIDDGDFDGQVIDYAYSKAVNWAILTNFKSFRAWYVTRNKTHMFCKLNLTKDDINQVSDELSYFIKENLFDGTLNKNAEVRGIKLQEIDITSDLTESLNFSRYRINNYIKKEYGQKYTNDKAEELTQGIINRLIFIKKIEAEGIEENKLEQIIRKEKSGVYQKLTDIFSYYRQKYDSDVFGSPEIKSEVEELKIEDRFASDLLKVISNPVDSERTYNFAAMDVDVLGNIYENYLAYIQKGIKLIGGKNKRKSQGIYYTPKYIVDYMISNTLEDILPDLSLNKATKLKILDPACGSGSFLIRAINCFDQYYAQKYKGYKMMSSREKLNLMKNNIFGVDLDEKAVSIAELNIYLKILTQKGQSVIRRPVIFCQS